MSDDEGRLESELTVSDLHIAGSDEVTESETRSAKVPDIEPPQQELEMNPKQSHDPLETLPGNYTPTDEPYSPSEVLDTPTEALDGTPATSRTTGDGDGNINEAIKVPEPAPSRHKVTLEDEEEAQSEHEPVLDVEPEPKYDGFDDDDDFGDFGGSDDDFDSFEAPQDEPTPLDNGPDVVAEQCRFKFTFKDVPNAEEKLRELLPAPGASVPLAATHLTPTSQMLWTQLMASPEATLVEWNRSAIHRRLAVALGAPLDLDQSLPKVEVRNMALPAVHKDVGLPDMSEVVNWRILTTVSAEALAGMSDDELKEHLATLQKAIEGAQNLSENYESAEMEFLGEKEVLEGMVESMLVYAQKSQRTKLSQRSKKK